MLIRTMSRNKLVIKTVVITLIVQFVLGIIALFIVYTNYDRLTASKSGVSTNVVELKQIEVPEIKLEKEDEKDENILYEWNMGKIEYFYTKTKTEDSLVEEKKYNFNFNQSVIDKYIIINFLSNNNLLDKYIYNYLVVNEISNPWYEFENIINYAILLDNISSEKWSELITSYQQYYKKNADSIITNINEDNFSEVAIILDNLEWQTDFAKLPDNILGNTWLIKNENFQYVLGKLFEDKYMSNIKKISRITSVDYKLILSSIWVEQLRYLTTDRWYAKNLIKNNRYLTTFTKFSYGLGWIKTHTFNNINYWISQYNPYLYKTYFKEYDDACLTIIEDYNPLYSEEIKIKEKKKWKYDDEKIKEVLETSYGWTLYVWWLIYSIQQKRKKAWFSIDNKPWVIMTLYNMGNTKTPHGSPDLWGSLISVTDDKDLYFWEIGFIFFNYIKYYLDNDVTIPEIEDSEETSWMKDIDKN